MDTHTRRVRPFAEHDCPRFDEALGFAKQPAWVILRHRLDPAAEGTNAAGRPAPGGGWSCV